MQHLEEILNPEKDILRHMSARLQDIHCSCSTMLAQSNLDTITIEQNFVLIRILKMSRPECIKYNERCFRMTATLSRAAVDDANICATLYGLSHSSYSTAGRDVQVVRSAYEIVDFHDPAADLRT